MIVTTIPASEKPFSSTTGIFASSTVINRNAIVDMSDHAWFFSPDWIAGEIEASDDIANGRGDFFENGDAFLDALDD